MYQQPHWTSTTGTSTTITTSQQAPQVHQQNIQTFGTNTEKQGTSTNLVPLHKNTSHRKAGTKKSEERQQLSQTTFQGCTGLDNFKNGRENQQSAPTFNSTLHEPN